MNVFKIHWILKTILETNFSYNKKKYNLFQKKIEILSVTSYFFIINSKCCNKPNLKKLVRIDYFDKINFFRFLQVFFLF